MKKYLLLTYLILTSYFLLRTSILFAQNVQFTASANTNIATGEQFYLTYSVNTQGTAFKAPTIRDFNVLSGPSQSSSTNMQWINGQMTQSISLSFTYILQAVKEGAFTIPPASISVGGKTYQSNSITINVVKGSQSNASQGQQQNKGNAGQTAATNISDDDIFIRTIVSKSSAYKGEAILVTQKIYTRVSIAGIDEFKKPSYNGFWTEEIKEQALWKKENFNGNLYNVAEIYKTIIIPQKTGKLDIDPAEVTCIAQVASRRRSNNIFEDFFGPAYQNVKYKIRSKPVSIDVKNLPSQNQPADFDGAVGNFTFKSDIDKTSVKANEAVNLQITISGKGNLKLIDKLNIEFPADFETYDPKVTTNITTNESGLNGSKKFEYLFIPRNPGKFSIKPVTFSYFDLNSKTYKNFTTPEYTINVLKGDGSTANVTYKSLNQEDVKYVGSDIRFIKAAPFELNRIGSFFFGSVYFYSLLLLPLLLFILFVILYRRTIKQRSNIAFMRNKKATKVARKRLKEAEKQLKANNKELFYIEISKSLWGYLSDKFSIPIADLSIDSVNEVLAAKNVKEEIISKISETLKNCEFARFAPGDSTSAMNNIYTEAISTISLIENELK